MIEDNTILSWLKPVFPDRDITISEFERMLSHIIDLYKDKEDDTNAIPIHTKETSFRF
tara:strand:- start:5637 stop:5810 length:174 start_codon:yes stop_codon:yes gene_type:complete